MYLIRVKINRQSRLAVDMISNCQACHKFMTALFGTDRKTSEILYRYNTTRDNVTVYIYANRQTLETAKMKYDITERDISGMVCQIRNGQYYAFDLVAAPSKDNGDSRYMLTDESERAEWLSRKGQSNGFRIIQQRELAKAITNEKHGTGHGGIIKFMSVQFQGVLEVTDAEAFRKALSTGIGHSKAYGMGMMLLKPTSTLPFDD